MPAFRPLPSRPNLEFERKEAKALLRLLKAAAPDAITRAATWHPSFDRGTPKLSDAQLIIAREHGFASWPGLVRYFQAVQRIGRGPLQDIDGLEGQVRSLLAEHRTRRAWTARALAAYVPRFFGRPPDEVFEQEPTLDDARLAVARLHKAPSWAVAVERAEAFARTAVGDWDVHPERQVAQAIRNGDLAAVQKAVAHRQELLAPPDRRDLDASLLWRALLAEREGANVAGIIDWLVSQGLDLQLELNHRLCGDRPTTPDTIRWLLARGANPDWVAPNGYSVLEHALVRYWNAEAVDVLAAAAAPRRALWISAGLGDAAAIESFFDANGQVTEEARQGRPDMDALSWLPMPTAPHGNDDELLLEALLIAVLNDRGRSIETLARLGAPIDSLAYGTPLLSFAVGNRKLAAVEAFVRAGADLDQRGWRPAQTPREMARSQLERSPDDAEVRRIASLCGLDVEREVAMHLAAPLTRPSVRDRVKRAVQLAQEDAARLGLTEVGLENLFFGLLRCTRPLGSITQIVTKVSRLDLERFRAAVWHRIEPTDGPPTGEVPPLDASAQAALDAAIATAAGLRRDEVCEWHLLHELAKSDDGAVARWVLAFGGDMSPIREALAGLL